MYGRGGWWWEGEEPGQFERASLWRRARQGCLIAAHTSATASIASRLPPTALLRPDIVAPVNIVPTFDHRSSTSYHLKVN